jgi:hypothetical protein
VIDGRIGPRGTRVYRARVYYRGRYVASRTFSRKRDAQEWERKQVETLKTGAWADPKAGERPVREWCGIWLSAQPARAQATERRIRGVIARRRPLVSVRPSEVQAWRPRFLASSPLLPLGTRSVFSAESSITRCATVRSIAIRPRAFGYRRRKATIRGR